MRELKWPTAECEKECKGLCGYCPVHEKARRDKKGDWIIGPEPGHWGSNPREQPTVYMSTTFSEYPEIRSRDSGIQYGRGTMKTTQKTSTSKEEKSSVNSNKKWLPMDVIIYGIAPFLFSKKGHCTKDNSHGSEIIFANKEIYKILWQIYLPKNCAKDKVQFFGKTFCPYHEKNNATIAKSFSKVKMKKIYFHPDPAVYYYAHFGKSYYADNSAIRPPLYTQ
jgi:hypothetical protein